MAHMTRAERENFFRLNRARERAAKNALAARSAQLTAEFERQLDTYYSFNDNAVWEEVYRRASHAVQEAQRVISETAKQLGIPKRFAPEIHAVWTGQQYVLRQERAELRKLARAQLTAAEKAGQIEIERRSLEIQTELVADSLTTSAAKAFLERLPSVERLMPPLELKALLSAKGDET